MCELYHNGAIVRVFGRPKILEIVYDPKLEANEADNKTPTFGINLSREYFQASICKNSHWEEVGKRPADDEKGNCSPEAANSQDDFAPNPNLSLNIGIVKQPSYIYLGVAIL